MLSTMFGLALAATSPLYQAPTLDAKLVAISMFKNGYAMVRREVQVPKAGESFLTKIPAASLGTLWFIGDEKLRLQAVDNVLQEVSQKEALSSIEAILRANLNKSLVLTAVVSGKPSEIRGNVVSVSGSILVLRGDTDQVIPLGDIQRVSAPTGTLIFEREVKSSKRSLRVRSAGAGTLTIVSLERGATWAPSYALRLDSNGRLQVTLKSTILNDLEDIEGAKARLITGFPNVPYMSWLDPLVSGNSTDEFVNLMSQGDPSFGRPLAAGRGGQLMTQNAMAAFDSGQFASPGFVPAAGEQLEDLFFYSLADLAVKKGDRAYRVVNDFQTSYSDVYGWEMPENAMENERYRPVDPDGVEIVNHLIRFKNSGGSPFTTGVATLYRDNQVVGQDTLKYVPAGTDAEVTMNRALDIRAKVEETEIERTEAVIKDVNGVPVYDRITIKAELEVTNYKKEAVTMRIRRRVAGEMLTKLSDVGGESKKLILGARLINPVTEVVFRPTVAAGKTWTVSYQYKMLVRR